jgi:hypothetical protein
LLLLVLVLLLVLLGVLLILTEAVLEGAELLALGACGLNVAVG